MYWTSDGKVLIEWSGCMGPTFRTEPYELDPLGEPILGKYLGSCEVWRSSGATAVSLGETEAEAFLDEDAPRGAVLSYWVMQKMEDGGERQIGPVIDVTSIHRRCIRTRRRPRSPTSCGPNARAAAMDATENNRKRVPADMPG